MADVEIQELEQDELWEERTLNLLQDSIMDQVLTKVKTQKGGWKKHRIRWMKRPMAIPEVIVELQDPTSRESALRCLSTFLLQKREEDPENYYRTGYFLYYSCSTMAILLQEVLAFFGMMTDGCLTARASKRLVNVLTLFQCIAANQETRHKLVNSCVPNFLVPIIIHQTPLEIFENVRAVALSVFGILCQARESNIIHWALDSNIVEVCRFSIEIGNELAKVIGMHILEAILQNDLGMFYICNPMNDYLLTGLMSTWRNMVNHLAVDQDFSPRLLFHIIRCYVLLCSHARGFTIVMESLPDQIINGSFNDITQEFPVIGSVLQQLLLIVGRRPPSFSTQWQGN